VADLKRDRGQAERRGASRFDSRSSDLEPGTTLRVTALDVRKRIARRQYDVPMPDMTKSEWMEFLSAGTRTGKLATTGRDGRPHVVPIWFVLEGDELVFMTGAKTVKGRALERTGWASLCVDDQRPPYSFVTVSGPVTISADLEEMLPFSIKIAARYMGEELAEQFGRRNAVEGELLVRLRAEHVLAIRDVAD
jgi:PPOX class probable F420-dependent enzyme